MATRAKKTARKSTQKKAPAKKAPAKKASAEPVRLAMSKPKSNYCPDDGRLLRADRTCPVTDCQYHDTPVPE
ncbi:hypothetical protein [Hyalangium rubrum]|uniref:Uncharacterized protein n=1 Tax=Hyalangium rubrum TaxID=3103134 RepID=A0ABU5H487_9BACT|nr:hypothetical protein [Hyalangium sp. s54d21]MDY7228291.1 hypothetical protein [Hyalangium sp. s54d21]